MPEYLMCMLLVSLYSLLKKYFASRDRIARCEAEYMLSCGVFEVLLRPPQVHCGVVEVSLRLSKLHCRMVEVLLRLLKADC